MRRAVVVAHPDDESLWFGGLLIAEPSDWTIVCCSIPRVDPIRAWKFFDACDVLAAKGRLLPFVETDSLQHLGVLDLSSFDQVVTHSRSGEYGHPHHHALRRFVAERWPHTVVFGGYGAEPQPSARRIALSAADMERKLAALRCYDHVSPSDGIPKWQALLDRYGTQFDLSVETYDRPCA